MNIRLGKCKVKSRRCQEWIDEPLLSWRKNRQCRNTAKFTFNEKCICTAHARKKVFEAFLQQYPPM